MASLDERAKEVFLAVLAQPSAEREAFLATACGGDSELLREVASLLEFHGDGAREEASPAVQGERFGAGDTFAGRYRMLTRIGRGGMGDVWRVDDLVLAAPVALKLLHSASPAARARILQEVRVARQITHPAVCRVFDVGEAGDTVFFSMELVEGEDLAALIKRAGRLPSERVVQIAHELCSGLAAAHAQGVLHRDIKPANILIDQDGRVRITDFGIAVMASETTPHVMVGTPGYMAPEQLEFGAPLTERTDLYALGVVLYELVTGHRHAAAVASTAAAPRPSLLAPAIDPQLERAILKALAPDPKDRPQTALALAAELPAIDIGPGAAATFSRSRRTSTRSRLAIATVAVAVVLLAGVGSFVMRPKTPPLTARDTVVLADFRNTTGDPVFDGTLKIAFAVGLEQSPFLKMFPEERVREDLALMQRSPDEAVTAALAREIARREKFKALLAGSIASLGRNYVVALEAIDAESGDVIARQQVEAASKEEVLTALGGATSKLRAQLGESLASIQRFDVPLPRATTPSLDALHAYSLALDQGRSLPRLESIPLLKRALDLDPNFALAQAELSGTYANTGQPALAPEWSRKAFELRDRVSERERYFISWRYYRDATQAWDKGLELARSWTVAYPREANAFGSLGFAALTLGQFEQAIAPLRESIQLDPKSVPPPLNLAVTMTVLNRFDEAGKVLDEARAAGIDHVAMRRAAYLLAFVANDTAGMARELDAALAKPEGPSATNWQPRASAFGGHIEKAHDEFRRSVAATSQAHLTEMSGLYSGQHAELHAIVGQCLEAQSEAKAAIALSRDNFTLEVAGRALAWCGADRDASMLAGELAQRFPDAIMTTHVTLPVIAAATAINAGLPARGLELLEAVRPLEHSSAAGFWPAYLRGQAQLKLKRGTEAAAEFRTILDHRGERPDSLLYPLASLGLGRALVLAGDAANARAAYQSFFDLWRDADPGLAPIKEARAEFARIPS